MGIVMKRVGKGLLEHQGGAVVGDPVGGGLSAAAQLLAPDDPPEVHGGGRLVGPGRGVREG